MTRTERHIEEFRKGNASIQVRDDSGCPCSGVPISVEQESHAFLFGCVVPALEPFSESDRDRYWARLDEVFNCLVHTKPPATVEFGTVHVDVAERIHLGRLLLRLDQLAVSGLSLQVHVWGETTGLSELSERDSGKRVAELYTLCFGHPSVAGVFWNGFVDGEEDCRGGGLLRDDLAPKYAHKVLQKLIGSHWHSRAAGMTDADGVFRFRGFFGDYRVVANVGQPIALVDTIALRRGQASFVVSARGE